MEFDSLIGPAVVAAVVSGLIAVVGMLVNRSTNIRVNQDKIKADLDLAERRFQFDKAMAERRFAYEREQAIFERRFELAEQLLSDAYRFRDLMKFVRNGASFGDEGQTRKAPEGEREGLKRIRDSYFVPLERLQKESAFISDMMAKRDAARAHFGEGVASAFGLFNSAIHGVQVAANMLIQADEHDSLNNRDLYERLRGDIWEPLAEHAGKNEIGKKIEEAVSTIEEYCGPVLKDSGSK